MEDKQRALDKALRSLSLRAHSEQEIVGKLIKAGFEEDTIAQAMQTLTEYKLLDDGAFAAQWAKSRARRGMGPWRIARELTQKGIDKETAEKAMEAIDEDASLESAVMLAQKHLRKADKNAKRRAYDALIRRGYGYDTARTALDRAAAALQEDAEL